MTETILITDDDPVQRKMLSTLLAKKLGYQVVVAVNGRDAFDRVQASSVGEISVVLMDIQMPEMDGFEALQAIRRYRPDIPVVMLTSDDDTHTAVRAIKEGASDFVVKPAEPTHLDVAIKNAIRISSLSRELAKLKRDKEGAASFADIVGYNSGLSDAVAYGRKAAASGVPVLISGETGVGKELFARAIHGESKRVGAPFVVVHCSAMQEHLVESMLFSPDKGAFRRAEGGTIFLDDVGDLPQEAQVRILRLLQHKEIEPAGSTRPVRTNVRIIAATERDLLRDVQAGSFRDDLYFRISILPVHLTPLRERKQDIVIMAQHFIERISVAEGIITKRLSKEAQQYLMQQPWLGNVRELENLIHRAIVLADDDVIDEGTLQQIHMSTASQQVAERRTNPAMHINLRLPDGYLKTMEAIEQEAMQMALHHFEGNITRAADALGMAKSTFYRKIKDAS